MVEKRSTGTTYDDHDSNRERDSHAGRDSHLEGASPQLRAGLDAAGDVMSTWTDAFYDYVEQVLEAQRQFAGSVLAASAPMLDVARHAGSTRSRTNESYNDAAEYHKRSVDNDMSGDYPPDTSRPERPQADESAKTRGRGVASAEKKLS